MSDKYADIIVDISHEAIDRTFEYKIPEPLLPEVEVGSLVDIHFGQGKKTRTGYVIDIHDEPEFDPAKIKEIFGVRPKGIAIESSLIKLASWMHETYGCTMITALKTVMPVKETVRRTKARVNVADVTIEKPPVTELNEAQQSFVDAFLSDRESGICGTYLLHGVRGSGKTEAYIACIRALAEQGYQSIVLIPEISLTYGQLARYKQHFGDRVAVINSRQSKGERYREFERAAAGEVDVVIGPRSALFTPCRKLGMIVIDEEHDTAYKSDQSPKYHARDVATKRCLIEGASLVLGSATPSMESYSRAKKNEIRCFRLPDRTGDAVRPEVLLVDMREELRLGNRSIISYDLKRLMEDRLSKKEQIMLFINRRGMNSFVSCRECGEAIRCPKCDVAMTLHRDGILRCHYCGYGKKAPDTCPSCGSKLIGGFGTGTEKVEEEVKRLFPDMKTLRMDRDTTMKKGDHARILDAFSRKEADCLIGTQMIVKGHDFPDVTLVGIMLADLSLFTNDYRAGERTYDLLAQAIGRSGRGDKRGTSLIQTYQPEHYAIAAAAAQDFEGFYDTEMTYRRLMHYPPASHMMVFLMTGEDYETLSAASEEMTAMLKNLAKDSPSRVFVIGPSDATIGRINNVYRRVIYAKSEDMGMLASMAEAADAMPVADGVLLATDLDPMNMY